MRLLPDEQTVVDEIIEVAAAAHDKNRDVADVALHDVERLAAGGIAWAGTLIVDLARLGMVELVDSWRRRQPRVDIATPGGKVTSLPRFAGVAISNKETGEVSYVQLELLTMNLEQIEANIARDEQMGKTLMANVSIKRQIAERMKADGLATVADAIVAMDREAAA